MGLSFSALSEMAAALAAVIGFIWIGSRLVQFFDVAARVRGGGGSLQVEETLALDGRRRLYLVRCVDRRLILLTGGEQDQVIGWMPRAGENGNGSA